MLHKMKSNQINVVEHTLNYFIKLLKYQIKKAWQQNIKTYRDFNSIYTFKECIYYENMQCVYIEDMVSLLMFEIVCNIRKYSLQNYSIEFGFVIYDTYISVYHENNAKDNAYYSVLDGRIIEMRGESRMRGLGLFEYMERKTGIPYWECKVKSPDTKRVRFEYPIAHIRVKADETSK